MKRTVRASQWSSLVVTIYCCLLNPAMADEPIRPLEPVVYDATKVALGRQLFSDVRLSHDKTVSCASCHRLDRYGADNLPRSVSLSGKALGRNTPTVFNSAWLFTQMWDGRFPDLETRVEKAVVSPALMGMPSWDMAVERVAESSSYQAGFLSAYGEAVSAENIQHAIAEFQRSLVLLNSPFDRYLRGDQDAINSQAKQGYQLFKEYGCVSCHQGANVGGNLFQKMGAMKPIDLNKWNNQDSGRYRITGKEWDKNVFKVPSLRLVVKTAPYFHDGSAATLKEAIDKMTVYQLDRPIPDADKEAIIAFLHTLPGELPASISSVESPAVPSFNSGLSQSPSTNP